MILQSDGTKSLRAMLGLRVNLKDDFTLVLGWASSPQNPSFLTFGMSKSLALLENTRNVSINTYLE